MASHVPAHTLGFLMRLERRATVATALPYPRLASSPRWRCVLQGPLGNVQEQLRDVSPSVLRRDSDAGPAAPLFERHASSTEVHHTRLSAAIYSPQQNHKNTLKKIFRAIPMAKQDNCSTCPLKSLAVRSLQCHNQKTLKVLPSFHLTTTCTEKSLIK
jgi:hypothetical protein